MNNLVIDFFLPSKGSLNLHLERKCFFCYPKVIKPNGDLMGVINDPEHGPCLGTT